MFVCDHRHEHAVNEIMCVCERERERCVFAASTTSTTENRWQNNAAAAATTTTAATTAATATTATCHLKDVTVRLKNERGISLTGKESDFQSVQPF